MAVYRNAQFTATESSTKHSFPASAPVHLSVRSSVNRRIVSCFCSLSMNGCEGDPRTPLEIVQTHRLPSVASLQLAMECINSQIAELNSQPPDFRSGIIRLEVTLHSFWMMMLFKV